MANFFKDWKAQRAQAKKVLFGNGEYYKFDEPRDQTNKHYFMAEPLMTPMADKCDCQRLQMFTSHISQTVHLVNPEFPKVFTNFENQVGEYSMSYAKAKEDFKIIAKIQKNALNYDLIVQYIKSGVYDVIHYLLDILAIKEVEKM